jgi:putative membrane protein
MIPRYSDHAANERTYLAWVRTGIAITAFGFALERFGLLLHSIADSLASKSILVGLHGGREAGIAMVVAGLITLGMATWRFVVTAKRIQSEESFLYSIRTVLVLGGIILIIGLCILVFVLRATSFL